MLGTLGRPILAAAGFEPALEFVHLLVGQPVLAAAAFEAAETALSRPPA